MLSSYFTCDQIYKYEIYNFGHTLLCYLSQQTHLWTSKSNSSCTKVWPNSWQWLFWIWSHLKLQLSLSFCSAYWKQFLRRVCWTKSDLSSTTKVWPNWHNWHFWIWSHLKLELGMSFCSTNWALDIRSDLGTTKVWPNSYHLYLVTPKVIAKLQLLFNKLVSDALHPLS